MDFDSLGEMVNGLALLVCCLNMYGYIKRFVWFFSTPVWINPVSIKRYGYEAVKRRVLNRAGTVQTEKVRAERDLRQNFGTHLKVESSFAEGILESISNARHVGNQ